MQNRSLRLSPRLTWAWIATAALIGSALAVRPGAWVHQNEADFSAGKLENTVVSNLGDLKLARGAKELAKLEGDDSIVYDIARLDDGRIILAIGPTGKLAEIDPKSGKLTTLAEFKSEQIFALAADQRGLWIGVSGEKSRLELRSGKELKVELTFSAPKTRYLWDIAIDGKTIWAAAGDDGKVLAFNSENENAPPIVALTTKQKNILCLGVDAKHNAYAGTDGEGLVYRISKKGDKYESFVMYDAAEPEIGAILVLKDGTVYAGTADAEQAKPGRLEAARSESKGRVEVPIGVKSGAQPPNVSPKPEPKKPGESDKPETKSETRPEANADSSKTGVGASVPTNKSDTIITADASKPDQTPTPEQYNQLREAVRARLEQAKESGRITLQNSPGKSSGSSARLRTTRPTTGGGGSSSKSVRGKQGNAIYRIDSSGFVREVFRESVMILRLCASGNALLVATGNEGEFYRVDPDAEEVTLLANLEQQQIPAMLEEADGQVLVGTANPGRVLRISDRYSDAGTLTSIALDAQQISQWGKLSVSGLAPSGTTVEVQTRSGNVNDPEAGGWSGWSKPIKLSFTGGRSAYADVPSPSARFLQYRVKLGSDGKATPSVQALSLKYLMPNLKPRINAVKADYGPRKSGGEGDNAAPRPQSLLKVEWESEDPNSDKLRYTLEARHVESTGPYLKLADELESNNYDWDTRTFPDGRYILRVVASDAADNAPGAGQGASRLSDPVTVDNTPPSIIKVIAEQAGSKQISVKAEIQDDLSPIAEIRYNIDSGKQWQLILPVDRIYDSTNESIAIKIPDLSPGQHVLTLRAVDSHGNSRYLSQPVTVGPAEGKK